MNDKINKLLAEIEVEKRKIANCKHVFTDAFYDPETVREPHGYKMEAHGSDISYQPEGYHDVKKDRWARKCTICGLIQHTYQTEPIIKEHKPKF